MYPPPQLLRCARPVLLIDPPPQCRRLQPPSAKVEGEVDDGGQPSLWLGSEYRAVAQRGVERGLQVLGQIDLALVLTDRRMVRRAQMTISRLSRILPGIYKDMRTPAACTWEPCGSPRTVWLIVHR